MKKNKVAIASTTTKLIQVPRHLVPSLSSRLSFEVHVSEFQWHSSCMPRVVCGILWSDWCSPTQIPLYSTESKQTFENESKNVHSKIFTKFSLYHAPFHRIPCRPHIPPRGLTCSRALSGVVATTDLWSFDGLFLRLPLGIESRASS